MLDVKILLRAQNIFKLVEFVRKGTMFVLHTSMANEDFFRSCPC